MKTTWHASAQRNEALRIRICIWLLAALAAPAASAQQLVWSDVDRVVAISDPHGAYDAMVRTLQHAAVIDDEQNWSGGATHLVITGEVEYYGAAAFFFSGFQFSPQGIRSTRKFNSPCVI